MKGRIKDLPQGVGIGKVVSGRGKEYWRVRLGKRFTGGSVILKDFPKLEQARKWIFGEAQDDRANPGAILDIKERAGTSAFELSAAQLHESSGAIRELEKVGMTLADAVQFAIDMRNLRRGRLRSERRSSVPWRISAGANAPLTSTI